MNTQRLEKFQENLIDSNIDACLLVYSRDIFYYTGTSQPGFLLITPESTDLFVKRNIDFAKEQSCLHDDNILQLDGFQQLLRLLRDKSKNWSSFGLGMDVMPANMYQRILDALENVKIVDISDLILLQRMIKEPQEIEYTREAARIVSAGHQVIKNLDLDGLSELQLSAIVENEHRLHGHEGIFFIRKYDFFMSRGPISSGENLTLFSGIANSVTGIGLSAAVPAGPSLKRITKGDIIVIDIPVCYKGYHADQTRTFVVGKAPTKIKDFFYKLHETYSFALSIIKEGACCQDIYNNVMSYAQKRSFENYFLNCGDIHAGIMGHGIGLELNEPPMLTSRDKSVLQENCIIALEMHAFDPSIGTCKIEEMLLIKKNGFEILTVEPMELCELPE